MKQNKILLILVFFSIVSVLSMNIPLIAEQQDDIHINPVTLSTYAEYYHRVNFDDELTILYPRSSIPVILEPDQSFIIQFTSIAFDSLTAEISTAYDAIPDNILLSIDSIHQEQDVMYATATIPVETPQELYNITLTIESEGEIYSTTRPRAVSIKDAIDDSFTFIHLADFHIGDPRGLIENPKETIGWKAARKVIEEVNLLNPDFVIISGDLVFGQMYPFEYTLEYKKCYDILQEFDVPTFLCPGNHDGYIQTGQDGLRFWEDYFGPVYYSFDYGNMHFLSVNSYDWPAFDRLGFSYIVLNWGGSVQDAQMQWIADDLDEHIDADQTLMMMHHNPLWDTTGDSLLKKGYQGQDELLNLIRTKGVDGIFAGHVHYDNVTIDNGTTYITTTTLASSLDHDAYWGYRLVEVEENVFSSYNYKEPKYSVPSYHINIIEQDATSITIENLLDTPMDILVEFVVPNEVYTVNHGSIIQIREKEEMAAVYVLATLPQQTTTSITLS